MRSRPQLQPFTLSVVSPDLTAAGIASVFPQMKRVASYGLTYGTAQIVFQNPVRLWAMQMDWALNTHAGVLGFQVIMGQSQDSLAFGPAVTSLGGASTSSTTVIADNLFVEFPPDGLLIQPNIPIALYAYTAAVPFVTDNLFVLVNLFITMED